MFSIFFCNRKSITGGQTLLCDGITLLNGLPKDLSDKLINQNIIYKRTLSEDQWHNTLKQSNEALRSWRYDTNPDGTVSAEFRTKATWKLKNGNTAFINSILPMLFDFEKEDQTMEVFFEDGTGINKTIGNIILDIADQVQTEILLEENQAIAVDNRWILHGRKPYTGSREMFTRMSVADLNFKTV